MTNEDIEILKGIMKDYSHDGKERIAIGKAIIELTNYPYIAERKNQQNDTMTNAEWCIRKGIKFSQIQPCCRKHEYGGGYYFKDKTTGENIGQIVNVTTLDGRPLEAHWAFKAWLDAEHEDYKEPEPILTGEERGYLKQVIRPFREAVKCIEKIDGRINFDLYGKSEQGGCLIYDLPAVFEYRGMKERKEYTLQELGL